MRFNSALLLLGSISGLFTHDVLGAPIRIVVVEKVALSEADAFLKSVRIGHPGANSIKDVKDGVDGETVRIPGLSVIGDVPLHVVKPVVDPSKTIPMTPDAEFNILPFPNPAFSKDQYIQLLEEYCEKKSRSWTTRFRNFSNWVREMLGLPPVLDISPCPPQFLHKPLDAPVGPSPPLPVGFRKPCHNDNSSSVSNVNVSESEVTPPISGPRYRRPGMWGRYRPRTFYRRLQRALYSLTPWEGRALAFVVGCGLGVLLRMVYVFIILGARALRCRNQSSVRLEEEDENDDVTEQVVEGVILFDAGSIKAASQDDLALYYEKD